MNITKLYQAEIEGEKAIEKIQEDASKIKEQFELWSNDPTGQIVLRTLTTRADQCLKSVCELASSGDEKELRAAAVAYKTFRQTFNLITTGQPIL